MMGYVDIGATSARVFVPIYENDEIVDSVVYKHKVVGRGKEGFLNTESLGNSCKRIAESVCSELDTSSVPPCCVAVKDSAVLTDVRSLAVRIDGKAVVQSDVLYLKKSVDLTCPEGYIPLHRIPLGFRFDEGDLIADPTGQSGEILSFHVMLIAARHSELKVYSTVLNDAGIKVHRFIYDGLAHGLAAMRETEQNTCTVFDLGENTTGVSVFSEGAPVHFGFVPAGMDLLSRALMRQLRCSGDTAEKLMMTKGMAAKGNTITYRYSDNKSDGSVDVPLFVNTLSLKLNTILQAAHGIMARSTWPEKTPSYRHKIVLTGGGRSLSDLPRVSAQLLKVETIVARGSQHSNGDNTFMACIGMWLYMEGDDFGEPAFVKLRKLGKASAGGLWQWFKSIFN